MMYTWPRLAEKENVGGDGFTNEQKQSWNLAKCVAGYRISTLFRRKFRLHSLCFMVQPQGTRTGLATSIPVLWDRQGHLVCLVARASPVGYNVRFTSFGRQSTKF